MVGVNQVQNSIPQIFNFLENELEFSEKSKRHNIITIRDHSAVTGPSEGVREEGN